MNPDLQGPLHPVWLVLGQEELLVRQAVATLVERALEGGLAAFNRADGSAAEPLAPLISAARTPPMMGPRRAVVVRDMDRASVAALDLLADYAQSPCPSTVLILHGPTLPEGAADRAKRLRAAVERAGRLLKYDPREQDPVGFVADRVQTGGCRIGRREAELVVALVGRDLGRLASEVDKLLAWMGGPGTVTAAHIEEVCSLLGEAVIWDLTDAIVRRASGRALGILHRLLDDGEPPERVLPMIAWQVRILLSVQSCLRRRVDPFQEGIKMPRDKMDAVKRSLDAHPLDADRILETLAAAHRDMHGHRAGDRRVLEGLVLGLCAR